MYSNSLSLQQQIKVISDAIFSRSSGRIIFEEYIVLPYYGNIILRFNINNNDYTLDDLDNFENIMNDCAHNDFLVDFMGNVYKNVGLNHQELDTILTKCYYAYQEIIIPKSIHETNIIDDAKYLLELCKLPTTLDVWEIQLEEEINLFILREKSNDLGKYETNEGPIHAYELNRLQAEGLMKATIYAKSNHISLVKALLSV